MYDERLDTTVSGLNAHNLRVANGRELASVEGGLGYSWPVFYIPHESTIAAALDNAVGRVGGVPTRFVGTPVNWL
jgi:hypothetical protein